jgi:hypothetical protein
MVMKQSVSPKTIENFFSDPRNFSNKSVDEMFELLGLPESYDD